MKYMNQMDIEQAIQRHARHPVLGPAARFLNRLCDVVNSCSDGWAYWKAPVQASRKLIELLERRDTIPEAEARVLLKKALTPIKSFVTKNKAKYFPDHALNFPDVT